MKATVKFNKLTDKTMFKMKNSQRKATDSMIHRIAELKAQYGANNADSYKKASDNIKKERK